MPLSCIRVIVYLSHFEYQSAGTECLQVQVRLENVILIMIMMMIVWNLFRSVINMMMMMVMLVQGR